MITISELKRRNEANGGHFFDTDNNRPWKSLDDVRLEPLPGYYTVVVLRYCVGPNYFFDIETGRIIEGLTLNSI